MSYCRFSDGDVYMYATFDDKIVCCTCRLNQKNKWDMHPNTILNSSEEALEHLKEHIKAEHKVPKYAIDRLREEINVENV